MNVEQTTELCYENYRIQYFFFSLIQFRDEKSPAPFYESKIRLQWPLIAVMGTNTSESKIGLLILSAT